MCNKIESLSSCDYVLAEIWLQLQMNQMWFICYTFSCQNPIEWLYKVVGSNVASSNFSEVMENIDTIKYSDWIDTD